MTTPIVDLGAEIATAARYDNHVLTTLNDHVVRISTMTEPYVWHLHPNSDETFLVVEGRLKIEFEGRAVELGPRQLYTVPRNVAHRTSPVGDRSVNLTIERADAETVHVAAPDRS